MKHLPGFRMVLLFALTLAWLRAEDVTIDSGLYPVAAAAQAVWRPMKGSVPVVPAEVQGRAALRLPCNFAGTTIERASWDRTVALDLAGCRGLQFEFFCTNLAPVTQFRIYLQSGEGWYAASFQPELENAWHTITVPKSALKPEGRPAGWDRITTVRLSAWRGQDTDTEFCVRELRRTGVLGQDASIAVLRAESLIRALPREGRSVEQYTTAMTEGLAAAGLGCATPSDLEVTAAQLQAARLVVLPYNPTLPPGAVAALLEYLKAGGRLLAFYELPAELRAAAQLEFGGLTRDEEKRGRFAAMHFAAGAVAGAPAVVAQRSWLVREAKAATDAGRVLAEWRDEQGRPSGAAAVIATPNCIFVTHVLLNDDRVNKRRMLLALAGQLVPELWAQSAAASMAKLGRVGGAQNFEAAVALIAAQAAAQPRVQTALDEAKALHDRARQALAAGKFIDIMEHAAATERRLLEAFCLAQRPQADEFRAFWCHSAFGVQGQSWDETIRRLADAGFTAILPNMLWGGVAFYPSKTLPVAAEVTARGDQIAQCLAACKKYGVQMHVWKVNWNTGHAAPAEFRERMRQARRLQWSAKGEEEPWLCPSHPENQALEIAAMVEVARDYDVTGLHFDYIRYPDSEHCFCAGCRARFGQIAGVEIVRWPQDVLAGGARREAWLEWRRSNITAVVRAVSEQARAVRPGIKISAAVFRNWAKDRDGVGQDWKLWCERGWVDFLCPMNYTESDRQFDAWITMQQAWAGKTPVYPGIGESASNSRLSADRVIGQIEIARRHRTGGFTIFNLGSTESRELLPLLSLGATAKP
ncbi:MAG: family 10 glycosylhydrolase [Opitutae bacterium]|nr:family 10 glycosylhydrolase [Opitutae bacterium]